MSRLRVAARTLVLVAALGAGCARAPLQPVHPTPRPTASPAPILLPMGGRTIFPRFRVVAFYGTPNVPAMGVLGDGSPDAAARRLLKQSAAYASRRRPVAPAFEVIATVAQARSSDGNYNAPIDQADIARYLDGVRKIRGLLILDVQPGRAPFLAEVRRYERFLREPDVELALDPEWSMGPNDVPGQKIGATDAATVNAVSAYLAGLVARNRLPQKLLVLHQFTSDMIAHRNRIVPRPGLAIVFHIDGFGGRPAKRTKYDELAQRDRRFYNGFKLFYEQDVDMFAASEVLGFRPVPDLITYE